jgi:hypothetical protein
MTAKIETVNAIATDNPLEVKQAIAEWLRARAGEHDEAAQRKSATVREKREFEAAGNAFLAAAEFVEGLRIDPIPQRDFGPGDPVPAKALA